MTQNTQAQFKIGDQVVDRDGYAGRITNITNFDGARWYDVRFAGGEAVRFDDDLLLIGTGK